MKHKQLLQEAKQYFRSLNYFRITKHISLSAVFLFFAYLVFNYYHFVPQFWATKTVWYFGIMIALVTTHLALRIKDIPENKRQEHPTVYYFSHFFLLSLVIIALNQFLKRQIIIDYMPYLTIVSIALGFLTFYANRNKVEKELEDEKATEEKAENKRYGEFDKKFPRLKGFDFSYGFSRARKIDSFVKRWLMYVLLVLASPFVWFARLPYSFVRWMYGEGWWYSGGLIAIVVVGFVLRVWNIGNVFYDVDEAISGLAVEGFIRSGVPTMPSGFVYSREILSTVFSSIIPFLLGASEISLRLTTILFGMGSIIVIYALSRLFLDKKISLICSLFISIMQIQISFSRWFRMYALFQFFFLLFIYFIIKYTKEKKPIHLIYAIFLFLITFFIHRMGIILILFFLFIPLKNLKKTKKYILLFLSTIGLLSISSTVRQIIKNLYIENIYGFVGYNFSRIFSEIFNSYKLIINELGILFFLLAIISGLFILITKKNYRYYATILILLMPLLLDIFIYSQGISYRTRYLFFLFPIFLLLFIFGCFFLVSSLKPFFKWKRIITLILALILIFPSFTLIPKDYYPIENRVEISNKNVPFIEEYLNSNPETIIIASPIDIFTFYFYSPDYWIISHTGVINTYISMEDYSYRYTGSKILNNLNHLKEIEKKGNLIVLIDENFFRFIGGDLRTYIIREYTYLSNLSNDRLYVYEKKA